MLLFFRKEAFYKAPLDALMNAVRLCTKTPSCPMPAALFTGTIATDEFTLRLATKRVIFFRRFHIDCELNAKLTGSPEGTLASITVRPMFLDLVCLAFIPLFYIAGAVYCFFKTGNAFPPFVAMSVFFLLSFLLDCIPYRLESEKLLSSLEGVLEKAASHGR